MDDWYVYQYSILVLDKTNNIGHKIEFKAASFQTAMEVLKLKYEAEINSDYTTCDIMSLGRSIYDTIPPFN